MMPLEQEVESTRTKIETVMLDLDPKQTPEQHCLYLGGYIDCLYDSRLITEETHDILYAEYCS